MPAKQQRTGSLRRTSRRGRLRCRAEKASIRKLKSNSSGQNQILFGKVWLSLRRFRNSSSLMNSPKVSRSVFSSFPTPPINLKLLHTSYGRDGSLGGIRCFQLCVLLVKPNKSFFRIIRDFGHIPNDRLPRRTGLEG